MEYTVFLNKALENLAAAEICLERGYHNASANRAYYAMFQAAIAVLIHKGFALPPDRIGHDWVQATFARTLTKQQKIFHRTYAGFLPDAQEIRNRADYSFAEVSKALCKSQLSKTKSFFEVVLKELPHDFES